MERPENLINTKDYDKPQSFEKDWEAELYYSYIEAQKYIDYLEAELKKLPIHDVMRSVADAVGRNCPFCGEPCAECSHKATER